MINEYVLPCAPHICGIINKIYGGHFFISQFNVTLMNTTSLLTTATCTLHS